jgi:hypothetical protein
MSTMWGFVEPLWSERQVLEIVDASTALKAAYTDVAAHLDNMDFVYKKGRQPEAEMMPKVPNGTVYRINFGYREEQQGPYKNAARFIGAVLHEMMHITAARQYATNAPATGGVGHVANMNLPAANAPLNPNDRDFGLADNQINEVNTGAATQIQTMFANWDQLSVESDLDLQTGALSAEQVALIKARIEYAKGMPGALAHYDTVLTDLLFYLVAQRVQPSRSYEYAHRMLTEANARRLAKVGAVVAIPRAPLPPPPAPKKSFFRWIYEALVGASG